MKEYSYLFRISVNCDNFEKWKEDAIYLYNSLKGKKWFPIFGVVKSSDEEGYGTGVNKCYMNGVNYFKIHILEFTRKFPEYSFKIWYSYDNLTIMEIYYVRGGMTVNKLGYMNGNDINIGNNEITIKMTQESFILPKEDYEITNWFV